MADEKALEPLMLKKKLKANHAAHGGAWKVAYADFVTAMMAFFLLLWLLNATTDEQKHGISNFFEPETVISGNKSGSSGLFGGLALDAVGTLRSAGSPPSVTIPLPSAGGPKTRKGQGEAVLVSDDPNPESINFEARKREEAEFNRAQADLRLAVEQNRELSAFQDSLLVDRTPEGLRIQLIDQEAVSMFEPGSAKFTPYFEALLEVVTRVVRRFPNEVAISGHTESEAGAPGAAYGNWELSGERANAARRIMVNSGMNPDRIASVVGRADTDPLYSADPASPRNRRISILLVAAPEAAPPQPSQQGG